MHYKKLNLRIHLTNVVGLGASELLKSLLPELERLTNIETVYLPDKGPLSDFYSGKAKKKTYRRFLPNSISRFLECTLLSKKFGGNSPLLILGDLPLRVKTEQVLLIQTPHLFPYKKNGANISSINYLIARFIFHVNYKYVSFFIVQSEYMRERILMYYPKLSDRIYVIPNPVPTWLSSENFSNKSKKNDKLHLVYPAADYPHKNHDILVKIKHIDSNKVLLYLTVNNLKFEISNLDWIKNLGRLNESQMINIYANVNGILFLSNDESYGFPLIEAMYLGLPIICPDLPYAKAVCGDQAIYFDPCNPSSIADAINKLIELINNGWKPNWENSLSRIPLDWKAVAKKFIEILN
jgi:glycosyltransferase involved in cell wall biosynthesis